MLTLYLIRHGKKQTVQQDPELTVMGHEQAEKTGSYFATKDITKIIASPMCRTQQTAQHISQQTGIPFSTDDRLRERMDYQEYKEKSMDSFIQEWIHASEQRDYVPKWGDSSFATGTRVQEVVKELPGDVDERVVLVTHGGSIADFLKNTFKIEDLEQQLKDILLNKDFDIKECSIFMVKRDENWFTLELCHFTDHLR